ncbi:nucleotidyltransferase domain-containing protein [Jeotgalibacillus aurantiacus]|uniref:nucleotidyltransferase domain-containing protein n=1 Tax=Jeotgalibacillus aurantiacus TaxID=2763266 RepID=UPI001D0A5EA9|nr:nucleotidyltransferase family protein [Jeotgalibacillus aurantiacus]
MNNSNRLTTEFIFMLSIINRDSSALANKVDWSLFLKEARHHRVYPILYVEIMNQQRKDIPDHVLLKLELWYKQNVFKMLHLAAEMNQLNQLFHENKIRMMQLKGPEMGKYLYGDLSLRTSGDLDIMVPIEKLKQAEVLLSSMGYEKDDYIETVLGDWKWRHHHVAYLHPAKKIKVELHWRLNPGPSKEPGFERLWSRKCSENHCTHFLGKEDYFYFLVHHGARHGWSRLRWLLDIQRFIEKQPDWTKMKTKEYQHYSPIIAGQALTLVQRLFHTKLPKETLSFTRGRQPIKLADDTMFYLERMINLHDLPLEKEVSSYHKKHLYSLMSRSEKLFFAVSTLYPYPEDARTLPLPKSLHVLYFPLRPALWIWRKSRGQVLTDEVKI